MVGGCLGVHGAAVGKLYLQHRCLLQGKVELAPLLFHLGMTHGLRFWGLVQRRGKGGAWLLP